MISKELRRGVHAGGARTHQSDRFHAGVGESCVARKLRQAADCVLEGVDHLRELGGVEVGDDLAGGVEGEFYDWFFLVGGGQVKDGKDVFPAGFDIAGLWRDLEKCF